MSLIDGIGLVEWRGCLFDPSMPTLAECMYVDRYIRERGGSISWTEVGRPWGDERDVPVGESGRPSSETISGRSTAFYQYGRKLGGFTPEAAYPYGNPLASDHTKGIAADTNSSFPALRAEAFRQVGWIFNIPSESWHAAKRLPYMPGVDLSSFAGDIEAIIVEDDMFSDNDRYAMNLVLGAAARMELGVYGMTHKTDLILWATTDEKDGLRQMVANLTAIVKKGQSGQALSRADLDTLAAAVEVPTALLAKVDSSEQVEADARAKLAQKDSILAELPELEKRGITIKI